MGKSGYDYLHIQLGHGVDDIEAVDGDQHGLFLVTLLTAHGVRVKVLNGPDALKLFHVVGDVTPQSGPPGGAAAADPSAG